ncbi:ERO1-like protein beta isoform X2 [Mizuhopecten yessoensis]|uniref:ERO1-like protein beta isoform X2 n=1 Tax=Mizuhopecten yessoensis TaxID=6573 RepID=UPI000B45ACAB|nr:ERO1-like protein beta isoform X2 [Mizuhopecten yessoensis]
MNCQRRKQICKFLQCVVFILTIVLTTEAKSEKQNDSNACFCKLNGEVDDCTCKVENLDTLNNEKIYPVLESLLQKDYFRFFKVNLKKQCPFWSDDSRCAMKDCSVSTCKEDQVPEGLKNGAAKYAADAQNEHTCDEERELGALNSTISAESKAAFQNWTKHDDKLQTFCELDDDKSADMEYVDLLLNPERYTGYKGVSPHRIWRSIYEENCFKPNGKFRYGSQQSLAAYFKEMCLEKRAFYRLISGLHTSINLHLSAKYLFPATLYNPATWGPNLKEFTERFDPDPTKGRGPQYLKNLYFTYLVELRAIAKAAPYLEKEEYFTGDAEGDSDVKKGIKDFIKIVRSFPDQFDESKLFQGIPMEAGKLREEFRTHFLNISRIMDCVGCDKCKLWGKLQVQGMGTALKILFSGDSIGPLSTVDALQKQDFQLRRTEIVSLFNAFGRLSSSIKEIQLFKDMLR